MDKYEDTELLSLVNGVDTYVELREQGLSHEQWTALVAYREAHGKFHTVDDLLKVRGIGRRTVAKLRLSNISDSNMDTSDQDQEEIKSHSIKQDSAANLALGWLVVIIVPAFLLARLNLGWLIACSVISGFLGIGLLIEAASGFKKGDRGSRVTSTVDLVMVLLIVAALVGSQHPLIKRDVVVSQQPRNQTSETSTSTTPEGEYSAVPYSAIPKSTNEPTTVNQQEFGTRAEIKRWLDIGMAKLNLPSISWEESPLEDGRPRLFGNNGKNLLFELIGESSSVKQVTLSFLYSMTTGEGVSDAGDASGMFFAALMKVGRLEKDEAESIMTLVQYSLGKDIDRIRQITTAGQTLHIITTTVGIYYMTTVSLEMP
jgi:competence ComEA-like helix-hairpin-helix protein